MRSLPLFLLAALCACRGVEVKEIACDTDANCPREQRCGVDQRCVAKAAEPSGPAAPALTGTEPPGLGATRLPLLRGTTFPLALVEIYAGDLRVGGAHADAQGRFDFALSTPLPANTSTDLTATATDPAARVSARSPPLAYVHDDTAPAGGSVIDGPSGADDLDVTASATMLEAHWTGFTDANAIFQYEFSITGSAQCPGGVVEPTATEGGTTSTRRTSLALTNGVTYSTCVRATDAAGNKTEWIRSDGVRVDPCSENRGGCDAHAACDVDLGFVRCACGDAWFGNGWACTAGFQLGEPSTLASVESANNWISGLAGAAVTKPSGEHHVVTAIHRAGGSLIDEVVDFKSMDGTAWLKTTLGTLDYSATPPGEPWGRGIPGLVSATLDAAGNIHALAEARRGTGYWSPGRGWYFHETPGGWANVIDVVSDEPVQIAQGNSAGAYASGLNFTLAFDPAASLLRFLGTDAAWYAVKYNALALSVAPGAATWPALDLLETVDGRIDRGAVSAASQAFSATRGAQLWVHKPTCALHGRLFEGGVAGAVDLDVPLEIPSCSSDAAAGYGFAPSADAVWLGDELHVLVYAVTPAPNTCTLRWLRRDAAGLWTRTSFGWDGITAQRAFVDGVGRLAILRYVKPARQLEIFHLATTTAQPIRREVDEVLELDLPSRAPGFAVWVETSGAGQVLKAAKLSAAQ